MSAVCTLPNVAGMPAGLMQPQSGNMMDSKHGAILSLQLQMSEAGKFLPSAAIAVQLPSFTTACTQAKGAMQAGYTSQTDSFQSWDILHIQY